MLGGLPYRDRRLSRRVHFILCGAARFWGPRADEAEDEIARVSSSKTVSKKRKREKIKYSAIFIDGPDCQTDDNEM